MTKVQMKKIKLLQKVLRAIKKKCKEDCCAMDRTSWVNCTATDCPLYPYRLGDNLKNMEEITHKKEENLIENADNNIPTEKMQPEKSLLPFQ